MVPDIARISYATPPMINDDISIVIDAVVNVTDGRRMINDVPSVVIYGVIIVNGVVVLVVDVVVMFIDGGVKIVTLYVNEPLQAERYQYDGQYFCK